MIGKASLRQKIEGVLGLSEVETIIRRDNHKTQKVTKVAKVFHSKILTKEILKFLNPTEVITGNNHIINIKRSKIISLAVQRRKMAES